MITRVVHCSQGAPIRRDPVTPYCSAMDRIGRDGRRAERILICLSSLSDVCDGGDITELEHALQTATRAERAGADDEMVLAALCHDVGNGHSASWGWPKRSRRPRRWSGS